MKRYSAPSLKVKEFNRVSILTASGDTPTTTNAQAAASFLDEQGVREGNVAHITL